MPRVREFGQALPSGGSRTCSNGRTTSQSFTYTRGSSVATAYRAVCRDDLGKGKDHDLLIQKRKLKVTPLNGFVGSNTFQNFVPSYWATANPSHPGAGIPNLTTLRTKALANSNPSRPEVSLPVFVGELRELPQLVKLAGDNLLKKAASANLSYQFGWKPLISDLQKLVNFQSIVDKRANEMERLYSKGGLKRRIRLGQWQRTLRESTTIDSACIVLRCSQEILVKEEAWATIRWRPTSRPRVITDKFLKDQARKAAFGIGLEAQDIWNLTPWSWLADWYGNVGDFLGAHANKIPASSSTLCVMRYFETKRTFTRTDQYVGQIKGGDASFSFIQKTRDVGGGPGISANLPFLSGRQLSILGSLSVLKGRGRR